MPHITTAAVSNGDQGSELSLVQQRGLDVQYPKRIRASLFDIGEFSNQWLQLVASTGISGYTLVNGTGAVISWPVPADGALHRVLVPANIFVTNATTGGTIQITFTDPAGNVVNQQTIAGSLGTGETAATLKAVLVQPGTVVSVKQSTAMTAGAAVLWAEIWGL